MLRPLDESRTDQLLQELGISPVLNDFAAFTSAKLKALEAVARTPNLPPTAYRLFIILFNQIRANQGYYYPRVLTLAGMLGVREQSIRKASRSLEAAELIYVDRCSSPYGTNRHFINLVRFTCNTETLVSATLIRGNTGETNDAGFTAEELAFINGGTE